jgi:NDP-sugar pyrophosphorylase family protein
MNGLKAMVLAAGHGVRLAPLTNELAKPACPVCNHPLIHFPLSRLASIGVKDVVVNLHHLPATVERAIENQPHPHPVAGRGRSAAGHRDTCGTAALGCGPRGAASSAPTRGGSFGLSVHTVFEAKILGTGGGLKNARSLLAGAETILLLNGDRSARLTCLRLSPPTANRARWRRCCCWTIRAGSATARSRSTRRAR